MNEEDIIRVINGKYVINVAGDTVRGSDGRTLCLGCLFEKDDVGCDEALTHQDPIMRGKIRYSVCEGREGIWRFNTLEEDKKPRRKLTLNTTK